MQLYKVGAQVFEQDARGPAPSGLSIVKDPLLPVIQGLMRFRPSDRISLSQALDMIRRDGEAKDEMDETEDRDG